MKISYLVILWIATIINIQAQNTLQGIVSDRKTNEPMLGVSVYVLNSQNGTTTDINGKYLLSNIQESDSQVVYSRQVLTDFRCHHQQSLPSTIPQTDAIG